MDSFNIKVLVKANCFLCYSFLKRDDVAAAIPTFPTATNLQAMKLYDLSFGCGKQITAAMLLLQKSPNLCELDIRVAQVDEFIFGNYDS